MAINRLLYDLDALDIIGCLFLLDIDVWVVDPHSVCVIAPCHGMVFCTEFVEDTLDESIDVSKICDVIGAYWCTERWSWLEVLILRMRA